MQTIFLQNDYLYVLHPKNSFAPTLNFSYRYFETDAPKGKPFLLEFKLKKKAINIKRADAKTSNFVDASGTSLQ